MIFVERPDLLLNFGHRVVKDRSLCTSCLVCTGHDAALSFHSLGELRVLFDVVIDLLFGRLKLVPQVFVVPSFDFYFRFCLPYLL